MVPSPSLSSPRSPGCFLPPNAGCCRKCLLSRGDSQRHGRRGGPDKVKAPSHCAQESPPPPSSLGRGGNISPAPSHTAWASSGAQALHSLPSGPLYVNFPSFPGYGPPDSPAWRGARYNHVVLLLQSLNPCSCREGGRSLISYFIFFFPFSLHGLICLPF